MSFLKSNKLVIGATKAFIFGKSISLDGHIHSEYATNGKVDGALGLVKVYDTISIPAGTNINGPNTGNHNLASTTIDLTDIGFDIYKALVTIGDTPSCGVQYETITTYNLTLPALGQEVELVNGASISSQYVNLQFGTVNDYIRMYRKVSLASNILTLSTACYTSMYNTIRALSHKWTNVTFKFYA